MRIGQTELLIILAVVIILFGPTQIPKLTKMFGKSVKNFRDGMSDDESSQEKVSDKVEISEAKNE